MVSNVLFSSKSDEWATPQNLFDELNKEFNFTLDPCASIDNAKCEKFFTIDDDGLMQDWSGHNVFVNPPYSDIKNWVYKSLCESIKPNTKVVMLIPARTDTIYFHTWIYPYADLRFIKGRLKFGSSKNSAPFPSMIVIFRGDI